MVGRWDVRRRKGGVGLNSGGSGRHDSGKVFSGISGASRISGIGRARIFGSGDWQGRWRPAG